MTHQQHIADLGPLFLERGIRQVIVSPGSRNAPLIQLFTETEGFRCHSVVDERSAGYVALGMARQLNQPVAIVTTSGTAVLNLAPAIAEAFHQQLPLLILTADRPLERIGAFNNQVIDQQAPFFNYSKGFVELPLHPRNSREIEETLHAVNLLLRDSFDWPMGPAHINIPLEEPLYAPLPSPGHYPSIGEQTQQKRPDVVTAREQTQQKRPDVATAREPADLSHAGSKILLLAGMGNYPEELNDLLYRLKEQCGVAVVAENISNLDPSLFIAHPELVLAAATPEEREALRPHLIITLGGQVVSKKLKLFLQSLDPLRLWEVKSAPEEAAAELEAICGNPGKGRPGSAEANKHLKGNTYGGFWKQLEELALQRAVEFLDNAGFCNLKAIREVLQAAPSETVVHLGNSTTIRSSQLVPARDDLSYFSNRGTSGIDGVVSSAVGAARVSDRLHLLLVGDLSMVYDSNALWNKDFPENLRIVVLNDGGGGIFRLLEGPGRMGFFEEFSVTHHPVSLELLSQAFGRGFLRAGSLGELRNVLGGFLASRKGHPVLEIDTTKCENTRLHKALYQELSE